MSVSRRSLEDNDQKQPENHVENMEKNENDEEHLKKLDPDKFVEAYGAYGRYQIITYILVQSLNFFYSSSIYVMSFVQLNLATTCKYQNKTIEIGQTCLMDTEMSHHNLKNLNGKTCGKYPNSTLLVDTYTEKTNLLIEFDLTCDHWFFQEFGLTIFTIGAVVAVPIMSILADRYGRKPIIVATAVSAFLANAAAAFSPNYIVFLILRAIVGASSDTYLSVGSVATCEYISEKARAWITVVYNIAWTLGMLWTLLVTVVTDDWRWRYFITVFPGIYAFALFCFLPESPHWLIVKNKTIRLKKYIETSNKINKTNPDFTECQQDNHHTEKHESLRELCGSRKLLWILFANGVIQMVIALVYFAISFLSVELGDDHIKAFLYSSVVEIPAGLLVLPVMIHFGRRKIVVWCLALQALSFFGISVFLDVYSLKLVMMLIAKVMATIIYSVHPIWATEQFPTSVRSLCFSIMNIPQSMGVIMSPWLKHLKVSPAWLPFLVIGISSFISAVLAYMLHETKNVKMPIDVESLSNMQTAQSPGKETAKIERLSESKSSESSRSSRQTETERETDISLDTITLSEISRQESELG